MERINGFIAAPFTPLKEDGSLNLDVIPHYANFYIRNGIVGSFICGTSGEGYLLAMDERKKVAEKWITNSPKDFKNIIHVGASSLKESQELADHALDIGSWGFGIMPPALFKPANIEALVDYCAEIAAVAPHLPFYYYHMPSFNGVNLSMVSFLKQASSRIPNLAGIKYTHEDLYEFNQCMLLQNGKFEMLHGRDETLICGLALGATGGVGGTYNHVMNLYIKIREHFLAGDMDQARHFQNLSQDFINVLVKYGGNVTAGKRMMKFIGLDCGPNRLPIQSITDDQEKMMKKELSNIGFFEFCNK